eukprot:tig00001333_g8194.t1
MTTKLRPSSSGALQPARTKLMKADAAPASLRHVEVFRVDNKGNPDLAGGIRLALREGRDWYSGAIIPAAARFGLDPKGARLATLYGLEIASFKELRPEISHLVFLQCNENFCRPVRTMSEALQEAQSGGQEAEAAPWRPGFVLRVIRSDADYQQPVLFTVRPEMTLEQAVAGCARLLKMKAEGMALFNSAGAVVRDLGALRDGEEVSIRSADGSSIVLAKTPERRQREADVGVGACTPPTPASPSARERPREGPHQTCILTNVKGELAPAGLSPERRRGPEDCNPNMDPASADVSARPLDASALSNHSRASPPTVSGRAKTPQQRASRLDPDADRPLAELASSRSMRGEAAWSSRRRLHLPRAPSPRSTPTTPPSPARPRPGPAPPPEVAEGLASPKQRPRAGPAGRKRGGEPAAGSSLLSSLVSWSATVGLGRLAGALGQAAGEPTPRTLGIPADEAETPWLRLISLLGYCCAPKGLAAPAGGGGASHPGSVASSVALPGGAECATSGDFAEMLRRNPVRDETGAGDSSFNAYRDVVRSLARRAPPAHSPSHDPPPAPAPPRP